ncbi:MAG: DUF3883 domain-containing protein, partial [Actinomycetia bacterium]|nr:DUF3883 domain-containing protein [Actinomycetes bacterium]
MPTDLEGLVPGVSVEGLVPAEAVTVVHAQWHGADALTLTYRTADGSVREQLLYRDDEPRLSIAEVGQAHTFDADSALFRLGLEAQRIRLAYLFDPMVAVHTSRIDPLPHQIEAVYSCMLPRQPLRFLLADDPGAGKTIMAGLFIRELIIRSDLTRCLVIAPGSLVEQWQEELWDKFGLAFDIISRESVENSRTGNPFAERDQVIARLDHLARNEELTERLATTEWDLIVVDEAHKMSAHYVGDEVKYTKRYQLGQKLGGITRHLLLMTATPHSGSNEDFQLFMALLDCDRFAGKPRRNVKPEVSDMMRRLVKENLLRFDGRPLFPERRAYTVQYELSPQEAELYNQVTEYVRTEMNRVDRLRQAGQGRRGAVVGFALTTLQRRLASSPEAILRSLERRRKRLEEHLEEAEKRKRRASLSAVELDWSKEAAELTEEDWENIDDLPDEELEELEDRVMDEVTAAQTVEELKAEIESLTRLESVARMVRHSGTDRKWERLAELLAEEQAMFWPDGSRRKLIVFTEHKDTLEYLAERIRTLLGRPEEVVTIHGGMSRELRRHVQEAFTQDRHVSVLVATDAAGEGINLQRAHLMVNYDLPWNPNRIEQRFGRIHRIGQTEVCHMWNLVAKDTREGDVFRRLFEKLERMRQELKGQVFDVLGQVFIEQPLRELIVEAIRYGEQPEVKARLERVLDETVPERMRTLVHERALASDVMTAEDVFRVKERLELAQARKLQPYYIASFFRASFEQLGGRILQREAGRYELKRVPSLVRERAHLKSPRTPLLRSYERITFDKELVNLPVKPVAELIAPGHPLLEAVSDVVLERAHPLFKRGAVLVADADESTLPRLLVCMEHTVHNALPGPDGRPRVVSRQMQFVEIAKNGAVTDAGYAPHLDYRAPTEEERALLAELARDLPETPDVEQAALDWAIQHMVPQHVAAVREQVLARVERTMQAVRERLTHEIAYWDNRAEELKAKELAGKAQRGGMNSGKARARCEELRARLDARMAELERERELAPAPPVVHAAALVVPAGLLRSLGASEVPLDEPDPALFGMTRREVERLAVEAVLAAERSLGRIPEEQPPNNPGFDILSRDPQTHESRFIEVKGRIEGATTVTVSKNEVLHALNKSEDYVLAIVRVHPDRSTEVRYVRRPFEGDAGILFDATSVNYDLAL